MEPQAPAHPLAGRTAVVTGAGRGIGRRHALTLAALGASVLVNDLGVGLGGGGADPSVAAGVVSEIRRAGGRAAPDTGDIAGISGGERVVRAAADAFGRVDIVVNNAGFAVPAPMADIDDEILDSHLALHLKTALGTARAALPGMRERGWGRIVTTVSPAGLVLPNPGSLPYAAAKAALQAATLAMAAEVAGSGVTVNAVSPAALTRMSAGWLAEHRPAAGAELDPQRVADVVAWLVSDLAAGVNGRVLRVEGDLISEVRLTSTRGVRRPHWTPALIAADLPEIARR